MPITSELLRFLAELKTNNNREWFADHKGEFQKVKIQFDDFVSDLIKDFSNFEKMDGIEAKHCVFRIYRDVRFSKDKAPYKPWFSAAFSEGGKNSPYMDYYLHIEPGDKSFLGGGMYAPEPSQLVKFRQEIDYNGDQLIALLNNPKFASNFGQFQGESLKKMPKGYPEDHPYRNLLKQKQFFFWKHFNDNELLNKHFQEEIILNAKLLKPVLDFLNASIFDKAPTE
ncbi:MAG: hypothetical protein RJA76_1580 [Bacteroidota bacterium]|jgi:uncharacterized protein (TIGR02453 family)